MSRWVHPSASRAVVQAPLVASDDGVEAGMRRKPPRGAATSAAAPEGVSDEVARSAVCYDANLMARPSCWCAQRRRVSAGRGEFLGRMTPRDETVPAAVAAIVVAAIVVAAFLFVDLSIPRLFERPHQFPNWLMQMFSAAALGLCIGQLNLVATWAVFAPGNLALRLPWALLLTVLIWYALILGNRAYNPQFTLEEAVIAGMALIGGSLGAQVPLWIASRLAHVRLVQATQDAQDDERQRGQFRMRHVLAGMVLLSLALAPLRALLPQGDTLWPRDFPYLQFAAVLGAMGVCNLLITVPCIWGAFLPSRKLPSVAVGWAVYCAVLTVLEATFLIAVSARPPNILEHFWVLYFGNLVQCLVVFGVLLLFRAIGFQLVRVKRDAKEVES